MKLLIISDTHFGFAHGTEREKDSFIAFEKALNHEADMILLGGDVFDSRSPTTDTFAYVMEMLLKPAGRSSSVRVADSMGKELRNPLSGVPVVAIHGNHERRVHGLVNPVEALERGGFLIHLHCNGLVFEKDGERVAVHGLSAVPDQYAESALKEWNPKPVSGAFNVLLFHQNLEGFLFSPHPFPKDAIPEGFDLYVCGDIHESHQAELHDKPLLLPGSTVATQVKKEATQPRKIFFVDTKTCTIEAIPLEGQRKIYYEKFENKSDAEEFIKKTLQEQHTFMPIIKIQASFPTEELLARWGDKALLRLNQEKEVERLSMEEQKASVQQTGKQLLEQNLKRMKLDPRLFERVFELLLEKRRDDALTLLRGQNKNNEEVDNLNILT